MICNKPWVRDSMATIKNSLDKSGRDSATGFPCGQCLPCRINRSRVWKHRVLLEAADHGPSSFCTLTYSPEEVPKDHSVEKRDAQKWLKRLRHLTGPVRYFLVGEYGVLGRPHYHCMLFGIDPWICEQSKWLEKSWKKGFTHIGECNNDTASYIVGYCVKHWTKVGDKNLQGRKPEFMLCSKGLGKNKVQEIGESLKNSGHVTAERIIRAFTYGRKRRLPLGRYLTEVLSNAMGVSEDEKDRALSAYQIDLLLRHTEKGHYGLNLVSEGDARRHRLVQRHRIFKKGKKL